MGKSPLAKIIKMMGTASGACFMIPTIKGGDYRSREANVYRLAECSLSIIDLHRDHRAYESGVLEKLRMRAGTNHFLSVARTPKLGEYFDVL